MLYEVITATSPGKSGTTSLKTGRGEQEVIAAGKLYQIDMAWSGFDCTMSGRVQTPGDRKSSGQPAVV